MTWVPGKTERRTGMTDLVVVVGQGPEGGGSQCLDLAAVRRLHQGHTARDHIFCSQTLTAFNMYASECHVYCFVTSPALHKHIIESPFLTHVYTQLHQWKYGVHCQPPAPHTYRYTALLPSPFLLNYLLFLTSTHHTQHTTELNAHYLSPHRHVSTMHKNPQYISIVGK